MLEKQSYNHQNTLYEFQLLLLPQASTEMPPLCMPEDSMETAAIVSQIYSSLELYRQTGITISIMCDATNVFVGLLSNAQYFAV